MRGSGPWVLKLDCIEPAPIHNVMTKMPVLERITSIGQLAQLWKPRRSFFEIIKRAGEWFGDTKADVAPHRGKKECRSKPIGRGVPYSFLP
jgi:hypothetical protein